MGFVFWVSLGLGSCSVIPVQNSHSWDAVLTPKAQSLMGHPTRFPVGSDMADLNTTFHAPCSPLSPPAVSSHCAARVPPGHVSAATQWHHPFCACLPNFPSPWHPEPSEHAPFLLRSPQVPADWGGFWWGSRLNEGHPAMLLFLEGAPS